MTLRHFLPKVGVKLAIENGMTTSTSDLAGVRILILEDHPASARLLTALFSRKGCDVRVAATAEDALVVLETFPAQAVIADLVLPKMSGLTFVRQIKAEPATREILVIAVSVGNGPDTERLALESGCAAYIRKPIDVQTFTETVATLLRGKS